MLKEYLTVREIVGPLLLVEKVRGVKYGELVELEFPDGSTGYGDVLEISEDVALVQSFESTQGLNTTQTRVRFIGRSLEFPVSRDILGRGFDGLGKAMDGGPQIITDEHLSIHGSPINSDARGYRA